ncbi:MAG: Hpt domain-containing protein [Mogibacterium sp.]|nr:Hpt domain-containing protein [Mogibacterium sp.]
MLTIDNLKALGANTDEGLARCLGREDFYLRMVGMALADNGFEKLREAVELGNLEEGFERAHALKGVLANVSLTTLAAPIAEITEDLRARRDIDYTEILDRIDTELQKYRGLV